MDNARRSVTIVIPNERPISWNKMYAGVHWAKRADEALRVHLVVRAYLDPDCPMFDGLVRIKMCVYSKNRRVQLDADNICSKLYIDGLIGWLIRDDDAKHVRSVETVTLLDRQNPRVEIKITEVEDVEYQ